MNSKIKVFIDSQLHHRFGTVILEIGAHYGEDTKDMFRVFHYPSIYCFEPDPRNVSFIRKHFKISEEQIVREDGIMYLFPIALFNKNETVDFYLGQGTLTEVNKIPKKYSWIPPEDYIHLGLDNSGVSSLKHGSSYVDYQEGVKVQALRLDDWNKEHNLNDIDFIWLDVQGAEKEVIEGGRDTFQKAKFVWTEYGEKEYKGAMSEKKTIQVFYELGFKLVKAEDNNLLFERMIKNG